MRYRKNMGRRVAATFLAAVLVCSGFPAQAAWGIDGSQQKDAPVSATTQAGGASVEVERGADAAAAGGETADIGAEQNSDAATAGNDAANAATPQASENADTQQPAATGDDEGADASEPDSAVETQPYSIDVTFDGQTLAEGEGNNNLADVWTTGTKKLNAKLTRNKNAKIDSNKQYVLCMSVPDALYFSGVPEASKINGVEDVAMIQNAKPTFNLTLNGTLSYQLSPYSGQIRLLLNTSVDMVTIADLGVLFDPILLGYMASGNTSIADALNIRVVAVDASEKLDEFSNDDATTLVSRKIDSLQINNDTAPTTDKGLRMRLSTDGFKQQSATGGTLKVSRGGTIAYVLEAGQKSTQAYKKLTVVLSCPYIWVDADNDGVKEKHYLSFDEDSSALSANRLSANAAGFNMTGPAVYDPDAHTITYTFENVYLVAWQMIAVTPQFSWPEDLGDSVTIPSDGYQVYFEDGASGRKAWTLTEEQTYCGTDTTLLPTSSNGSGSATFINDGVNLSLKSSAEDVAASGGDPAKSSLGKREIYKEVTRANGVAAGLGFFDLHNNGVTDAPASKVTFEFNTDGGTGATYYVDSINIPLDGNDGGTDIEYTLVNGAGNEVSGSAHVNNTSSFRLYARNLMSGAGSGSGYYFKKVSYTTTKFRAGSSYHSEVSHGKRNFVVDYGLYFGYIEGDVAKTACAKMTIESADGSALDEAGDTKLESTETTWVGDDNSIYLEMVNNASTKGLSLDNAYSQSITAGGTTMLSFRPSISATEDQVVKSTGTSNTYTGILNGYHAVDNPIMYVCLPKDVSITGTEQASITANGRTVKATSVKQLANCTYEGVDATWWEVRFDGASIKMASARIDIKLSTELLMSGVSWNFEKAVAFRSDGQALKGTSTTTGCSTFINTTERFKQLAGSNSMLQALAGALESDPYANGKLGLFCYTYSVPTTLNIARAEAKLDVNTELSMGSTVSKDLKVTDANSTVNYQVDVSSTDGGSAENFNYYIPVAKQGAALDGGSFVSQKDYDLKLKDAVGIEDLSDSNSSNPFEVLYTTKAGLDSTSVAELSDGTDDPGEGWVDADALDGNYGAVTAVLIRTGTKTSVKDGAKYRFNLALGYDPSSGDFASQASRVVRWRSFGHYTYTRNGSETTNTYPSQDNSVKLGYEADLTGSPIDVNMATDAAENLASFGLDLKQSFLNDQALTVKGVTVSGGTSLVTNDPTSLTGSDANSKFRMALGVRGANNVMLTNGYQGGSFNLAAGDSLIVSGGVRFSRALTDTTTKRYVDVVLGNDDINIKVRIKLNRTVRAASVAGSGTAVGEQFKAVGVSKDAKTIAANGAFTALFDVDRFVPGNFTAQKLTWKRGGVATALPSGATVTMLVLGDSDAVDSMWLWRANGSSTSVDLTQFTRMAGSGNFSYDKASTTATRLKYQFVVSLPQGGAASGDYSLSFEATPVSGATAVSVELPVTLAGASGFSLSADGGKVTYGYGKSAGDDVRTTGKQLALVLTPAEGTKLPADACISANGTKYVRNASGYYIVPLGTVEGGSKDLSLVSSMADAKGGSYTFDAKLMLAGSDVSPMAGSQVGDTSVTLGIAASASPSIKVTGTRVAHKSDWANGEDFAFEVRGVPDGGSVKVSAFNGLTYTTPATSLLSNVGGVFAIEGAGGTYTGAGGVSTGKLVLSSAASAGTYRLVFEVKDADDTTLASTTYYVIVRE